MTVERNSLIDYELPDDVTERYGASLSPGEKATILVTDVDEEGETYSGVVFYPDGRSARETVSTRAPEPTARYDAQTGKPLFTEKPLFDPQTGRRLDGSDDPAVAALSQTSQPASTLAVPTDTPADSVDPVGPSFSGPTTTLTDSPADDGPAPHGATQEGNVK